MIIKLNLGKDKMYNSDKEVVIEVSMVYEGLRTKIYKMTPVQYKNYCTEIYGGGTLKNKCSMYYVEVSKETGLEFETSGDAECWNGKYLYNYYDGRKTNQYDTEGQLIKDVLGRFTKYV